jgi:ankyrin repeat protein
MSELHRAAMRGDLARVSELLTSDVDLDETDEQGRAPLHWAAMNGHRAVAAALLKAGATVNVRDRNGRTPLSWAESMSANCADFAGVGLTIQTAGGGDIVSLLREHGGTE